MKKLKQVLRECSPMLADKIRHSERIINTALENHNPVVNLVGYTGGGDSSTVVRLMQLFDKPFMCMLANTGTGIRETLQFVRRTCQQNGWPLIEQTPPDKTYEELVLEVGFPGPDMHKQMYAMLKERAFRVIMRMFHKKRDKMILTGVRKPESKRRKINVTKEIDRRGRQLWVSPIMYWTEDDKDEFQEIMQFETNPVSEKLGMSGECLCGAYAKEGELDRICCHYPDKGKEIKELEKKVKAKGFSWGWNESPPTGKAYADAMEKVYPGYKQKKAERDFKKKAKKTGQLDFFGLCSQCEIKNAVDERKKKYKKANQKAERAEKKSA